MKRCDEPVKVSVGDIDYFYQVFFDENWGCDAVRFCDDDGFIAEFQTKDEMLEYLNHAGPDIVNEEIDAIKRFRVKSREILARGGPAVETKIEEEEKNRNHEAFAKRICILKGDMTYCQFAKVVGLNSRSIFNIVCGAREPRMHSLKRIADRCGVSADWLLGN